MADEVRYPTVTVKLTGTDGNVFLIIGTVAGALRRQVSPEAATEFANTAMDQKSYPDVLVLVQRTVNVT